MALKLQRVPSERDDETEDNVVETDPSGRYVRVSEIMTRPHNTTVTLKYF